MVSAAVTREGHCSERESTQGGVAVGGPLQCWEEGDVFADWAALLCSWNSLPPEGWRGVGLRGPPVLWVGVVQWLGCRLAALRTLARLRGPELPRGGGTVPEGAEPQPPPQRRAGQRRARGAASWNPGGTTSQPLARRPSPGSQDLRGSPEVNRAGAGTRAVWSSEEASPTPVWSRRPTTPPRSDGEGWAAQREGAIPSPTL